MKKYRFDLILIVTLIVISLVSFFIINKVSNDNNLIAYIYYQNELVETIDLSKESDPRNIYIDAFLGKMVIEVKHNAIRVVCDNSKYEYCIHQGFSSSPSKPIICIPNKVYIKLISNTNNSNYDVVVG